MISNNLKLFFEIPTSWTDSLLNFIQSQMSLNKSFQIYGALPGISPTGRPNDVPQITPQIVLDHFTKAKEIGIETNYLLNGSNLFDWFNLNKNKAEQYFKWIIEILQPSLITVSDIRLIKILFNEFGWKSFNMSAIAGIQNEKRIKNLFNTTISKQIKIVSIVLHHNVTSFPYEKLRKISELCKNYGVRPTVMLTESCYEACPLRNKHYSFVGSANQYDSFVDSFQISCVLKRLLDPTSILDLAGFLLPEDIQRFSTATEIKSFKITGRSCSASWIEQACKCYLKYKSSDNLFDTIVFTSPFLKKKFAMNVGDLFFLDPSAYREITASELNNFSHKYKKEFLSKKAVEFYKNGKLKINDPCSQYKVSNGRLIVAKRGKYCLTLQKIISDIKGSKIYPCILDNLASWITA